MKKQLHLILLLLPFTLLAQELTLKPTEFISNAKDTVSAEIGTFKVPENRNNPNSKHIELSFIRFKSTNPNPGNPIVYLAGGPGGSGTGTAKGKRFELFMKLREVADVIAFDQRGTGLSDHFEKCGYKMSFDPKKAYHKDDYVTKTTETLSKCVASWKETHDLNAYNTTESAKDIDALRKALGVDKISLWGISYGSHLAFEYIRLFESNIDRMVLASLEGPNETIKLPANTEAFVDDICKRASDNYGTEQKYPNLKEKIIAVHERVKKEPVTATFKNRRGETQTASFSYYELQLAVAGLYLKNPSDSRNLPKLYTKMYNGDYTDIASRINFLRSYLNYVKPMSLAMDLQSGISKQRKKKVEAQVNETLYGNAINMLLFEWMETLKFPMLPEAFRELKNNKVDALLLSGTLDGRTYVSSAKNISKSFKNGHHVIIENAGHDLYMASPEVGNMVFNFFSGKEITTNSITVKPTPFR